jgi:hypothetical protein
LARHHFGSIHHRKTSAIMLAHSVLLTPAAALIAGILILVIPRLLNLIVALYLILVGLAGLAPHFIR